MAADRVRVVQTLLFATLFSLLFVGSALDLGKRKVVIRKLNMCKGQEELPMRWSNATVKYNEDTKETVFGLNLDVLEEVSNNFSMAFNFWKCDASGNPDSCEYVLKNYVNKEICKFMLMKKQSWTMFIEHIDKPAACPIKPDRYRIVDCPVNSEFLRLLPIGDAVWKVVIWGYDNDIPISCVDLQIQIIPVLTTRRRG